jgi:hypothetical protein
MSLYYEYKSCCSRKDNHKKDDHKKDHELDCFCGRFLNRFLGDEVDVTTISGDVITGILACLDDKTGIVTIVEATGPVYVCCKRIESIAPAAADTL